MSELVKRQDLPPPGGYRPIPFIRQPAKTYFRGRTIFAAYFAVTAASIYLYNLNRRQVYDERIEMRSSKLAVYPLLVAEHEREHLKQLYRNRQEEEKLMANVEGWKTGTWHGEPIFKTLPEEEFFRITFDEYYVHASPKETSKVAGIRHWT